MKVEIGFDLAPNGVGAWFTLDDPTKGKLDDTTYKLSGEVLVDVTDRVRSVSVKRGRSRTLDKFTAGVASVVIDNRDRAFDPLYASSPYYGSIVPRKMVRISRDAYPMFTGNIEDYSWDYDVSNDSTATAQAVDGFATLSQTTLTAGTATSQATGARVAAVLTALGWPTAPRAISTGGATLAADVRTGDENGLAYLQTVADVSEPGAFFMSKEGAATFRDRYDLQNYTTGGLVFGTGGVPFTGYQAASVTEEMLNSVAVTWSAGTAVGGTAVASNATSQAAYGVFEATYDTLLNSSGQAQTLADWLVSTYKDPSYRVDSITVSLDGVTPAQVGQVLDLECGDVVQVTWTPNAIGSAISQYVSIDAIDHAASPARHDVSFTLSQAAAAFILDSAIFGVLDTSTLGF